jgi:ferredoxin
LRVAKRTISTRSASGPAASMANAIRIDSPSKYACRGLTLASETANVGVADRALGTSATASKRTAASRTVLLTGGSMPDVLQYPKVNRDCEVCSLRRMTYVIVGSCIKDDSCIEVCPVDCIHPKPGAPDFETAEQLYIDPAVCIDCDACVEACPVDAIYAEAEVPDKYDYALDLNTLFFAELDTVGRTAR